MQQPVRIKLTNNGQLAKQANHYTHRGTQKISSYGNIVLI